MYKLKRNYLDIAWVSWLIPIVIVYSTVCFAVETIPYLSPEVRSFLEYSEWVVVTLFTVEYLYRVYVSTDKLKFIFSFYGFIDIAAILPFYLSTTIDLRSMRLLRLLRLARILKLARYNAATYRFRKALALVKEELIVFLLATVVMFFLAAVGIYHFEHEAQPQAFKSIFDCLWWAVIKLTTVGYGDIYPITVGGRFFTFIVLMLGLGLVAVPTGIVASALSDARKG